MRLLAMLAICGLICVGCETKLSPAALLARYMELHRAGDVNGLLALHTDDAEFVIPGQPPIRGREDLRRLYEWDAVLQSELVLDGVRVEGDSILVEHIIERNRLFEGLGVPEVHYRPVTRFVLRGGRVAGVYIAGFTPETEARLAERFDQLFKWLSAGRPQDEQRLLPDGRFRYDGSSARLWLEVLEHWNKDKE